MNTRYNECQYPSLTGVCRPVPVGQSSYFNSTQWPSGRVDFSKPGGPGFMKFLVSAAAGRRSSALSTLNYFVVRTPPVGVVCARLVTRAACALRLGPTQPVTTSGDDKCIAAKQCGRAKWSRISHICTGCGEAYSSAIYKRTKCEPSPFVSIRE